MAELTRGIVFDRPWGRTLAALGLRGLTGQLTLTAFDGKAYAIAFANGAVVGAASPIASDAAVRVALTGGLISTTQVAELARKQAAAPDRDEVDVITDHLRLNFDQAMRLRRRTIAQRAARTFSIDRGEFVVTDEITLPVVAGSELDVRAVIYLGAKQNLSEARLASELGRFGTWFRLKPEAFADLPQYGFGEAERPAIDALLNGASLGDLEGIVGMDGRVARATVYALCAANACNVEQTRGQGPTQPPPATLRGSDPGVRRSAVSQPPATQAAGTPAPRSTRPTQQPLVAYRPGMRRTGTTQHPPTGGTPRHDAATASGIPAATPGAPSPEATPPLAAASRRAHASPGASDAQPTPPRSQPTEPPARSGSSSQPGIGRTARPGGSSDPGFTIASRPGASSDPGLARPGSGSNPGLPRTAAPTAVPVTARTVTAARRGAPTRTPALGAAEVQALIAARAALIERGEADHYALLGVAPAASADDIRKTYFGLARQLHPDRLAALGIADDAHVAHKVFAQLNTAFAVLSDPKRRAEYDALLGRGGEGALREEQARAEEMAARIFEAEEAFKKGELALKRDDLATAIAELQHAVELNPDEPDFTALHAWAVFVAAPDKTAIARQTRATLERAIQRSPRAINPRFYLGRMHRMLGNDREALELFRDVLVDKPHHFEAQSEVRAIEARSNQPKGGGGLFGRKR